MLSMKETTTVNAKCCVVKDVEYYDELIWDEIPELGTRTAGKVIYCDKQTDLRIWDQLFGWNFYCKKHADYYWKLITGD